MPTKPSAAVEQQLQGAFESFRDALSQLLEAQAQQSVSDTLDRLGKEGGPFRVESAEIDVVIRNLRVTSGVAGEVATAVTAPKRARKVPTRRQGSRRRSSSPGRGGVKEAMLAAMGPGEELGIADFSERLKQAGVSTSNNNLHQQLRRLVQAGDITRSGRGRYRRA